MKRTVITAAIAAAAASAIMIGGLAAVAPANWGPRTPGPSSRPFLPVALSSTPSPTASQDPLVFQAPPPPSLQPSPLPAAEVAQVGVATLAPRRTPPPPRSTPRPVRRTAVRTTVAVRTVSPAPSVATAKAYALSQIGSTQYACLYQIWMHESGWNPYARNPNSGAYGIPQALPGTKMATAGSDWRTNPVTQVKWGLGYIRASYGSACSAWSFWQAHHWY